MSDQISEKMARNVYYSGTSGEWRELEDEFIANLKRKGLIKPSKLDEAREFVRKVRADVTLHTAYREAVEDAEGFFEAAITEILEERE